MNLVVGFGVLVTVALLENVSGQAQAPLAGIKVSVKSGQNEIFCTIQGGTCQLNSQEEKCTNSSGIFDKNTALCNDDTKGCCIPPGCVYGSKALRNGATVDQGLCRKFECKGGVMEKIYDPDCPRTVYEGKCATAEGVILTDDMNNQRCLIIKSGDINDLTWSKAKDACSSSYSNGQLASIEGITNVDGLSNGVSYWIGGSDGAGQESWTWLNGLPISSSRIESDCLAVVKEGDNLTLKNEACSNKNGYICELLEEPKKCNCNYNKYGCTLAEPTAPGYACQCEEKEEAGKETRCEGTVVRCNDPDSQACKNPATSFENCMQGVRKRVKGNCCGYFSAHKNYCY